MTYNYNKAIDIDRLTSEIEASAITIVLQSITALGLDVSINFAAAISEGEETILDDLVDAHVNEPLPEEVIPISSPTNPVHTFALAEGNFLRARLIGIFNQTVTKDQVTDLDWAIPQLTYLGVNKDAFMDGIQFLAGDAVVGDKMSFQVVDKDAIFYPANTVLDEFGKDWAVMPNQETAIRLYKAKLIPGLYIRIKYTSIGTVNDVKLVCNLFRHMDTSV